jgi:hypothetical protein
MIPTASHDTMIQSSFQGRLTFDIAATRTIPPSARVNGILRPAIFDTVGG